ncbi:hypothetical protein B0H16DRAFT_1703926 [Mycena metata]|uniref:Uncharacterized protein n=1 Tax=Mycena metata TaxID=1033252 RepID=A0AAD7MBR4_9AGAR|nr:hypothetical protein B0H16DRAFT_1703926 [Mycena metata]
MYADDDENDPEYTEYAHQQDRYQNGSDDDGESEYNDAKGIKYHITFQPQLPLQGPNDKKRRANARADTINRSTYIHEKAPYSEFLDDAIKAIGRDERTMDFKIVGDDLRTTRFKFTWTITRTDYKNMQLSSEADYKELVTETAKRAKVEAKLEITEFELEAPPPAADGDGTAAGNPAPAASVQNEEPADKHKHRKLNPEEEAMAKTILDIQNSQRCSDRACTSRFCFVGNPTAKHVRLTPLLSTWAAAILAEMPNVTVTEPPPPEEEKMFWPLDDQLADIDDISMLASRRRNISAKSSTTIGRRWQR